MRAISSYLSLALLLCPLSLHAANVQVIALTRGKATLVIGGAKPRTLAAGQSSPEGVRLISATVESAVLEFDGQRRTLRLGTSYSMAPCCDRIAPEDYAELAKYSSVSYQSVTFPED